MIEADADAVRLIARQAAGSVRDALWLLDQAIAYVAPETLTAEVTADVLGVADRRLLVELAGAALDRDAGTALRLIARAADRGVDFGELGRAFLGFLRDLEVIARVSGGGPGGQGGQGGQGGKTGQSATDVSDLVDATPEEIEEARALAGRAAAGLFPVLFDRWARAVDEASRLPTPRLLFEMAALDLCAAEPMLPLGDLLQRLDELESRLRGSPRAPAAPAQARRRLRPAGARVGGPSHRRPDNGAGRRLTARRLPRLRRSRRRRRSRRSRRRRRSRRSRQRRGLRRRSLQGRRLSPRYGAA